MMDCNLQKFKGKNDAVGYPGRLAWQYPPVVLIAVGVGHELHGVDHSDHHDHTAVGRLPIGMEDCIRRPKEYGAQIQGNQKGGKQLRPPAIRLDSLAQVGWRHLLLVCSDCGLQGTRPKFLCLST